MKKKDKKGRGTIHNSIMNIHESKVLEFSTSNKKKILNELQISIDKNVKDIEVLNKEVAINVVNNIKKDESVSIKIGKLMGKNIELKKEYEYINSDKKELDYILNTCMYIQDYIELDSREKELMLDEDQDVEKELYEINYKKNNIVDDYMKIVDPDYSTKRNLRSCMMDIYCDNCNIKYEITSGMAVCYECGKCISALHKPEELSYKEQQEADYRPQFTYEKLTHLEDWLRRFQAKEHKDIPQEVLDKVVLEFNKHKIKDLNTLTEQQVKTYLKTLELNDYYDNVISIINRINKRPRFLLTNEIETKVKDMFQQIQVPFEKHKDPNRKNMLSYSYLLNKFFLILDLPEFSKYFFLLKSPEKLRQQDYTFKKIVDELAKTDPKTKWQFFPSL
jgi:hypothetical protein